MNSKVWNYKHCSFYLLTIFDFLRHSTSVECLSAIVLRSTSALANQNVSMDLISQSRSGFSVNQFTPSICMCLYTRWDINTRSQNSFWDWIKCIAFQWRESSENISVYYICVDFCERFPSDGCMPSRSRPERIVRSNIRLRKKATRIIVFWDFQHCRFSYVYLTGLVVRLCIFNSFGRFFSYIYYKVGIASQGSRLLTHIDASLTHQNRPGFDKRGSYSFAGLYQ